MKHLGTIVVVASLVACGGSNVASQSTARTGHRTASREPRAEPMPHRNCVEGAGDVQQVDVNGDGRADVRTVVRGGRVYCRETDANFDGRVDIIRFFDEQERPVWVEDDYDFDGRMDVVATYRNGEIESDVLDTNFDGRIDTWREYRNGRVIALRRDANSDGRVDTWEQFDDSGRLVYSAVDADGDGRPDHVSDAGAAATPGAAAAPATGQQS